MIPPSSPIKCRSVSFRSTVRPRSASRRRKTRRPRTSCASTYSATAVAENWNFLWEGEVPGTARATGVISTDGKLTDTGASFCFRGVQTNDCVYITGCLTDNDCAIDQLCFVNPAAPNGATGLCVPRNPTLAFAAAAQCTPWTTSARHYRVIEARQYTLTLDEVPMPEHLADTVACQSDADCTGLSRAAQPPRRQPGEQADGLSARRAGQTLPGRVRHQHLGRQALPGGDDRGHRHGDGAVHHAGGLHLWPLSLRRRPLSARRAAAEGPAVERALLRRATLNYDVHAGDAFVVRGGNAGAFGGGFEPGGTGAVRDDCPRTGWRRCGRRGCGSTRRSARRRARTQPARIVDRAPTRHQRVPARGGTRTVRPTHTCASPTRSSTWSWWCRRCARSCPTSTVACRDATPPDLTVPIDLTAPMPYLAGADLKGADLFQFQPDLLPTPTPTAGRWDCRWAGRPRVRHGTDHQPGADERTTMTFNIRRRLPPADGDARQRHRAQLPHASTAGPTSADLHRRRGQAGDRIGPARADRPLPRRHADVGRPVPDSLADARRCAAALAIFLAKN